MLHIWYSNTKIALTVHTLPCVFLSLTKFEFQLSHDPSQTYIFSTSLLIPSDFSSLVLVIIDGGGGQQAVARGARGL